MASLLDSVKGFFRAAPSSAPLTTANFEAGLLAPGSGGRGPPKRGTRELIQLYNQSPWLRAVTSRIARGVASSRWRVFTRAKEAVQTKGREAPTWRWGTDRAVIDPLLPAGNHKERRRRRDALKAQGVLREVVDHPLLKLLAKPNEFMSGSTAIKVTQVWLDVKGEAFWLIAYGADGTPQALYPLPPHWVRQVPTAADPHFVVSVGTTQLKIEPSAMIWLKDVDPDNPYGRGTGVAESLGDELETDEFAAKYVKSWFFNSATPSLIVSFEGSATPTQLAEARDKWEQAHRGTHNAHRAHFATGKMNAVKLDTAFKDQQLVELRVMARDTVIQVYGVPPECIGVIEDSNRATIDAADYMMSKGVEHPRAEYLREEIGAQLLTKYKGGEAAVLEVEISEPEDKGRRLEVMKAQPRAFTLNEWREEANYEPLPDLDGQFPAAMPGQGAPSAPAHEDAPKPAPEDDDEGDPEPVPSP
ncbi:MAG: phage portal protein [Archangium sp.]|nr:phage portal protein [Archangium sp.]